MAEAATELATRPTAQNSVLIRMAQRFGVDANKLHATLKATAFKGDATDAQFMALLIVADQYKLNPLTKELFAFPDRQNGIVPVVSVDGWSRIINEHPQFDGLEFEYGPAGEKHKGAPEWIECIIYRKDRSHPTRVRERLVECARDTGPWGSHPSRMLRHKSLIQCARAAFGFAGIYDEDEAARIAERDITPPTGDAALADINAAITGKAKPEKAPKAGKVIDAEPVAAAPPLELTADSGAPSFAYVADVVAKAKTADDLDVAADLLSGIPSEQQRAELDVEIRARRKALGL